MGGVSHYVDCSKCSAKYQHSGEDWYGDKERRVILYTESCDKCGYVYQSDSIYVKDEQVASIVREGNKDYLIELNNKYGLAKK